MTHTPHELAEDLPEGAALIHALRESDAHFARLVDEYHDINAAVHRAETDVEPTEDLHLNDMRKTRMHLKDEIARILDQASA
ncbi:conserved domain protein [Rhodovulum sulfidophilum]|uniref:Conserved domain protein n=1 Tax=Rhodovulum sulfidophilum TaxID=35806 RepID=A0A0D6B1L2_RHOSU|nr:conserved domain protein [Rhodovulum sulfidophilum]